MSRSSLLSLLFVLAALTPCTSLAQQRAQEKSAKQKLDVDKYFVESTTVTSESGPQAITRNVLQDSQGMFWLATWNGVIQFDGRTFTNVTNKDELRRYRAFSLLEDNENNIGSEPSAVPVSIVTTGKPGPTSRRRMGWWTTRSFP